MSAEAAGRPAFTSRYSPAPTGHLHLGHVLNAIWVWGAARELGGRVLLRIEDHDRRRCRREYERALLEDLAWLGFAPDEAPVRQSDREAVYAAALERLAARGLVYACACTRRELAAASEPGAPELRYPGTCRARELAPASTPLRRVRLEPAEIRFSDLRLGAQLQVPAEQCGDLLARDRDAAWTYQFAVTVDDLEQGVDLIVRGEDLLASTGRQFQLAALLGRAAPPRVLHHALIRRADGRKLSKAHRDEGVRDLREAGWTPGRVLAEAARAGGLAARDEELTIDELGGLVAPALVTLRA
jgi:glutamyl-tRNA synthetase/glutamyl-Q tRNA(Asp) synthetase